MSKPEIALSIADRDVEQVEFRGMPRRKRTFTLRSRELATAKELKPGDWVHGTFSGRVVGLHYDETSTKKDDTGNPVVSPEWRRKDVVEVIVAELE